MTRARGPEAIPAFFFDSNVINGVTIIAAG
jgi:hypothetical protein